MRKCTSCGQLASQKISQCPACGSHLEQGIKFIDDYKILAIIHEGRSSMVCKALKEEDDKPVSIRIFTKKAAIDDQVSERLKKELEELKQLPADHFVQHYSFQKSRDGHWYRLSEWVDAMDWGTIFMSDMLKDQRKIVKLFKNIASVLATLNQHDHFMPYLILDDILIPKKAKDTLDVKINYKLSRFLNARATHHGPMLQKLLACHPDIQNKRAIDFKSGIWSLGKIFVELLTADHNLTDFSTKVDSIPGLHPDLRILLKIMLADDPDLRPQSMARVTKALSGILESLPYGQPITEVPVKKTKIFRELKRLKRTVAFLMIVITGTAVFSMGSWMYANFNRNQQEKSLATFVENYTGSTAFLMVEYWLTGDGKTIYKNKVEGTAFLVDKDGYMLTNRHVACPWLEDTDLFQMYQQFSILKKPVSFHYKMYLWFEGAKAFTRLPALRDSSEASDSYYLLSAYTSGTNGNLRIAGVPRSSSDTGEMIKSPFKNDFAVLKVDGLPKTLKPLPLDRSLSAEDIKRLEPVLILGFPLGNRTQADHINTSITRGHVRRTSSEIIQVDSSIYKGNSGGPAISSRGKVIGIASGVITDQLSGYFRVTTPLSDFGLILPISRPAQFVASIKQGDLHWDGLIDFSVESKLEQITALAAENQFKDAARLAEKLLGKGNNPPLLYANGMMHFCNQDFEQSRAYFNRLNAIETQHIGSLLMIYIIDWMNSDGLFKKTANPIFKTKWYDENEFFGYLARVLKNGQRLNPDMVDYEDGSERSWRLFIEGLVAEKNQLLPHAEEMYRRAIISAYSEDWVYYLAFSRLTHIQPLLLQNLKDKTTHQAQFKEFIESARENRETSADRKKALALLINVIDSDEAPAEVKMESFKGMMALAPENRLIIGRIAFYHATHGQWQHALAYIDLYFKQPARETALSMSLNLLKGQILEITGQSQAARNHLTMLLEKTQTPWYKTIIRQLLSGPDKKRLAKMAGDTPEKLVIMHTALGLWEEAQNNTEQATRHYREALSSYLDNWNEYHLSLGRIILLRQQEG